ncbi:pantoate--beta-alanine ligase [Parafrigoribacterium soli]|uniref:pantoate--beta-alanine ligase n=1 Tax=Parafrigoribacterium soli TaxID=3144663 RepID=UPI0032ECFAF3
MPVAVAETIAELRARLADARAAGQSIALVPTMGALHAGHLALVARAREVADVVVVSIFVNPLQFGPSEDLDRYPRDLDADVAKLAGVDHVFAPSVDEIYPDGPTQTRVVAGEVGGLYEGAARAGHFDGVLTVVNKLLNIAAPDVVVFGQKDAQQVFLVKRMVADLNLRVAVEVVPIVRESDGLALSSRNRYLSASERAAALGLSAALAAGAASAVGGADAVLEAARSSLAAQPPASQSLVKLDYLVVVDPQTLLAVDAGYRGRAVVLVAATVGTTRLIDNAIIQLG